MDRKHSPRVPFIGAITRRSAVAVLLALTLVLVGVLPAAAGSGYWSQKDLVGKQVTSVAADPWNSNILLAGTWGSGVWRSVDRGAHWARVSWGNPYVRDVEFDPRIPYIAYYVSGRLGGIADSDGGVFRSIDRGKSWIKVVAGAGQDLAVSQSYPNVVYAVGYLSIGGRSYQAARSVDRGRTWRGITTSFANTDLTAVAVDPTYSPIVSVGGTTEGGTGMIWSSTTGGASWLQTFNGAADEQPTAISDLAFNRTGGALYAAANSRLLRSWNDGKTWQVISTAAPGSSFVSVLGGRTAGEVFVGTSGSVYRSTSYGQSLTRLGSAFWRPVLGLALDKATTRTLYAATSNGLSAYTFP